MLKNTVKAALLSFMLFASALMIVALVITSIVRSVSVGVPVEVQETLADNNYILRAYNGHIAVYYGDIKNSPDIETTIAVDKLRSIDREKLQEGIVADSYDEVLKLLEDFGS